MGAVCCSSCCGDNDRGKDSTMPRLPVPILEEVVWRNLFTESRCPTDAATQTPRESEVIGDGCMVDSTPRNEVEAPRETEVLEDLRGSSGSKRRGTAKFEELKRMAENGITANQVAAVPKLVPKLEATVTQLGNAKWRLHGIYEDKVVNAGFAHLDSVLDTGDIESLPCNDKGRSLVFHHSLFRSLLTGARMIKDVPQAEAASAQKDLPHLSLRQLLRLRVLNIDFAPGGNSVHATLLSMVDVLIFQRLGKKAADCVVDPSQTSNVANLGRSLVMYAALAKYVPRTSCWVSWFEERRIFFDANRFACTDCAGIAIESGVWEVVDKSESDRMKGGQQKWLDYTVKFVTAETDLSPRKFNPGAKAQFQAMTEQDLKNFRGALRSVHQNG